MVEWKGELDAGRGGKSARLAELEEFPVPNFFVVTEEEIGRFVRDARDPEELADREFPEQLSESLEEACGNVDVSSEVRNASGRAKSLVGGQRKKSRVSVRIDGGKKGAYEHRLNVGVSDIEEAVMEVVESYYRVHDSGVPSVIVQKMVEAEISGAALKLEGGTVIEAVKGLGIPLEEGTTVPDFYVPGRGMKRFPESQLEATVNPMKGEIRTREQERHGPLLSDSQLESLARDVSREPYSVKFAYRRGTFYAVDAFDAPELEVPEDLEALNVSPGRVGADARQVGDTESSERPLVAEKGGYTSTDAQRMRARGVPARFSARSPEPKEKKGNEQERHQRLEKVLEADPELPERLKESEGIEFGRAYIESAEQVLSFERGDAVLDVRRMDDSAAVRAVQVLEADFQCLVVSPSQEEAVKEAVRAGFDLYASDRPGALEELVERMEREMMLDAARKILDGGRR